MRLPSIRPRKIVQVLKKAGFEEARQTGSHLILVDKRTGKIVPVPIHTKDIKRGLLLGIIKQSGLTINEFIKLL
jgi:mRNA interferase HicA